MSDWQLYTHCGTEVFVSNDGVSFTRLAGYSGGLQFGMTLCPIDSEGHGFMRAVYADGRTLTAEGIFHSRNENPVDGGAVQGFTFSFSQQEPTQED